MDASRNGYADIVKMLIDKGADVNAKNEHEDTEIKAIPKCGVSALFCAMTEDHFDIVKILLDKGADVNAKDE